MWPQHPAPVCDCASIGPWPHLQPFFASACPRPHASTLVCDPAVPHLSTSPFLSPIPSSSPLYQNPPASALMLHPRLSICSAVCLVSYFLPGLSSPLLLALFYSAASTWLCSVLFCNYKIVCSCSLCTAANKATIMESSVAAKYNPKTDLKQRPANSKDTRPGVWLLGRPKKQDKMTCKLCNKRIAGGIKRFKKHLAGGYGYVLLCSKVSSEQKK